MASTALELDLSGDGSGDGYGSGYGYGDGYGYDDGGCYLVARRIWTPYGWRIRRIQVCN